MWLEFNLPVEETTTTTPGDISPAKGPLNCCSQAAAAAVIDCQWTRRRWGPKSSLYHHPSTFTHIRQRPDDLNIQRLTTTRIQISITLYVPVQQVAWVEWRWWSPGNKQLMQCMLLRCNRSGGSGGFSIFIYLFTRNAWGQKMSFICRLRSASLKKTTVLSTTCAQVLEVHFYCESPYAFRWIFSFHGPMWHSQSKTNVDTTGSNSVTWKRLRRAFTIRCHDCEPYFYLCGALKLGDGEL